MGGVAKAMREAQFVLTNPTHFSVALRYRPGQDAAPVVVARGRTVAQGTVAELRARCGTRDFEEAFVRLAYGGTEATA